jgi:hypothetical protein
MLIGRIVYAAAVLTWLGYVLLHPWFSKQRLPASYGAEDAVCLVVAQCSVGVILLGFVFGFFQHFRSHPAPDSFSSIVVASSFGLLISWIGLIVLGALTMGLAFTSAGIVCGLLAAGLVLGCVYGCWQVRRSRHSDPATHVKKVDGSPVRSMPSSVPGLAQFTGGLCLAVLLSALSLWIDHFFPQPPRGEWGLRPFNWWTGPLIWIFGGIAFARWQKVLRQLSFGIAVGALAIGLLVLTNSN